MIPTTIGIISNKNVKYTKLYAVGGSLGGAMVRDRVGDLVATSSVKEPGTWSVKEPEKVILLSSVTTITPSPPCP